MRRTSKANEYGNTYLYRAVNSEGNTLDSMLSVKRDGKAAARFLGKVLKANHTQALRAITVDKNAAYPVAIEALKADETVPPAKQSFGTRRRNYDRASI